MAEQGKVYSTYVEFELKAERERRSTLDSRAQALITSAGALVTLLAGVAAFVRTGQAFAFPRNAVGPLIVALLALGISAGLGIVAGWNYLYDAPTPRTLDRMINERWTDDEVDARNFVATAQILNIETLRRGNNRKVRWLAGGQVALLAALVALGLTVYVLLKQY